MIFKHSGNKNAHNGLAWSLYFLSQLSSWASPSGLAKVQKQTLYSCIPASLLTFATVTSDSLSCLHLIKICSSREKTTSPFLPYAHPNNRHWTRESAPTKVLIFMTETLTKGNHLFLEEIHASLWSDTEMTHYQESLRAKWQDNWWKPLSGVSRRKKNVCSWCLSRRWTWPILLPGSSSLWTNENILVASFLLPHPKYAVLWFSSYKMYVEVKGRLSSTPILTKRRTLKCQALFTSQPIEQTGI